LSQSFRFIGGTMGFLILFFWISGSAGAILMVPMMMAMLLSISAFTFDKQSKWDQYLTVLPVDAQTIVASRYIFALLTWAGSMLVAFLFVLLIRLRSATIGFLEVTIIGFAVLLALAISLPLIYRFGAEKGRLILLVVFLGPSMLISLSSTMDLSVPTWLSGLPSGRLAVFLGILAIAALAASFPLSVRFYRKLDKF
jgi:hypothetical protein